MRPNLDPDGKRRYGKTAGNPGLEEDPSRCVEVVWDHKSRWPRSYQCTNGRGHGTEGLYCKVHDPERVKARREKQDQKINEKWEMVRRRDRLVVGSIALVRQMADAYASGVVESQEFLKRAAELVKGSDGVV